MSNAIIKAKRINAGLYEVSINGRRFEIEDLARVKRENGDSNKVRADWQLYEIRKSRREWMNDFETLADAKSEIASVI